MALTMRATGLGAGIDKDRADYTVYSGGWAIGRIYETRGGPDHLRWFWSLTVNPPMARSDRVATLEEAKAQLKKSWDAWKAWAQLKEIDQLPVSNERHSPAAASRWDRRAIPTAGARDLQP